MNDLVKRLRIKAGMIEMGERIEWGSDTALMREAADALEAAAPVVQGEPVYLYRRLGLNDFVTCDFTRYAELSGKPNFFETKILYAAPQPAEQQPAPDVSALVEALEEARHHVVISPDPVRGGFIQEIDAALAAHHKGGDV